jgi:hypothetical protein
VFLAHGIWALLLAVILGLALSGALGVRGPWAAPWAIFVVLFLFIWAGGVWITPSGPPILGVYWMPYVLFGVLLALLIAASSSRDSPRESTVRLEDPPGHGAAASAGLTAFFWLLIAALVITILFGYA